jgi:hypothetical protein
MDWIDLAQQVVGLLVGALAQWFRMRKDAQLGRSLRPPAMQKQRPPPPDP